MITIDCVSELKLILISKVFHYALDYSDRYNFAIIITPFVLVVLNIMY